MTTRHISRHRSGATAFCRMMLLLLILLLAGAPGEASAQRPESLPNPNVGNPENFIADPYDVLSRSTEDYINKRLYELRQTTTCEVAVAIVQTTGHLSIEDYAYRLFKHWGLGKSDKDNGVLLVIATYDRHARIEVGSGAEGALPDVTCGKIIRKAIVPAMREDNVNQAVSGAVDMIANVLSQPEAAAELRSDHPDGAMEAVRSIDSSVILHFIAIMAVCVFIFTLVMFCIDFFAARKRDNYRRAMTWYPHLRTYWWGALFSCGLALPIAFIAWRLYRHSRDVIEICDTCGAKMKKLSEDEDNAFLSASQDFEEKLGTVDYDVWLCPECGSVERFPYVEKQLKYRRCPDCNTMAMNLVMDKVVDPPTTKRPGHGERIYQCQFCRHMQREGYVIPKKADPAAAAIVAGAVAGMMRGSGGSGGGGFGGGFGGGSSSGGGASGGW